MEGISHEAITNSIPNMSKSTMQSSLVTPIIPDQSNARDLFSEKLKEIDAEIFKFDSPSHDCVRGSITRNYAVHDASGLLHSTDILSKLPTPHSRAIFNPLVFDQF